MSIEQPVNPAYYRWLHDQIKTTSGEITLVSDRRLAVDWMIKDLMNKINTDNQCAGQPSINPDFSTKFRLLTKSELWNNRLDYLDRVCSSRQKHI